MVKKQYINYAIICVLFVIGYLIFIQLINYTFLKNNIIYSSDTIIGALIAAPFALFGVLISIVYQINKDESEKESHKIMLLTQLKFTHEFTKNIKKDCDDMIYARKIVYDQNWHEHMPYIDLSNDELKTIVDWYDLMHKIEKEADKNFNGDIPQNSIFSEFKLEEQMLDIVEIIKKIS